MRSNTIKTLLFALVFFYFSYHLVSGEKGVVSMMKLSDGVEQARQEYDEVQMEKILLERKVDMLYPKSLDLDLLDEQSRLLLGYAGKNEVVEMY